MALDAALEAALLLVQVDGAQRVDVGRPPVVLVVRDPPVRVALVPSRSSKI